MAGHRSMMYALELLKSFNSDTMPRIIALLGIGLILSVGTHTTALAQSLSSLEVTPGVSVHRFYERGMPTMEVKVWGAVRTPGTYIVELDNDLLDVLTFAGGPLFQRDNPNVHTTVMVNLSREGVNGDRNLIFSTPLDSLTVSNMPIPVLQNGDVLTVDVDVTSRFGWRDGLSIFSAVGTVAVIVLNIMRLSQ